MLDHMDTTRLAPAERAALRQHLAQLSNSVSLVRRAETYLRYYAGGFALVVIVFGALALTVAVRLARHLSRQLSRPIDELVGWTRLIRRRLPLPGEGLAARGAPEFEALRQALRELATALEAARDKELEAERLRAFREVARRVAHEIKNPLTSMRIAVDQLGRSGGPVDGRATAVEVLAAETRRLERFAKEVSQVGRLPQGPKSEGDLGDPLIELGRSARPGDVAGAGRAHGAGGGPPGRALGPHQPPPPDPSQPLA